MPTTSFTVASAADLNAAIQAMDLTGAASAPNTAYSISFSGSFTLTSQLYAINLAAGDTLAIQGNSFTLDGGGAYNGFFDYAGAVSISNLAINDAKATGGGGSGGGAGLGGGLFVGSAGAVTLNSVTFVNDSAVGGSAGNDFNNTIAGGGGLDGGTGTFRGGGGGVGLSATGGGFNGLGDLPGIVLGAASGGSSYAFPGGASGGGGAYGNGLGGGGGGGVGGGAGKPYTFSRANGFTGGNGGDGGFGGGGGYGGDGTDGGFGNGEVQFQYLGAAGVGGAGGFGGGGGGGGYYGLPTGGSAGDGGFGGGGGLSQTGTQSFGGFGGGNGPGGGLGAGGAVFVQEGGSLTYSGGSVGGGSVAGGAGNGGGGNGSAFGAGLFLQGNERIALSGSLTIADVIADQSGSGGTGSKAGAGSLLITGAGTVTLSAANTYTGGTTLASGTLSLQSASAAGTGAITFGPSSAATLLVGLGDTPGNALLGFAQGETIDLAGVGLETTATPGAGNAYTFSGGGSVMTLHFDPSQSFAGLAFQLASDGNGGTDLNLVAAAKPSTVAGTQAGQATTDETAIKPFAAVVIADPNAGTPTETVTVTPSTTANGTLSDPNAAMDGGTLGGGYTLSGTAAVVTAALDGLVFTPVAHAVAPGQTETTGFTIKDVNSAGKTTTDSTTSVVATAVNDRPTISGTVAGQMTTDNVPIKPFTAATIADVDLSAQDSLTITLTGTGGSSATSGAGAGKVTLTDANGTLAGAGLTKTGTGTYALAAASPAALTSELEALTFTPTQAEVPAGQTVTTGFSLAASQNAGGSTVTTADNTTSVVTTALNYVNGPAGGFAILRGTPGVDVITAHGSANAIFGNGGNDIVDAGNGAAAVTLGNGNATVTLGGSLNVVIGGTGNATVTGAPGGYTAVTLGDGNDTVRVGGTHDVILLGNGTNLVSGTQGMAFISSGAGNDTITLGGSGSTVNAGGGTNTITGGAGQDTFVLPKAGQGFDGITGFTEANGDVLDLRAALAATGWNHKAATLGNYLKVSDSGGNATLLVAPTGSGGGTAVATLTRSGNLGLADLLSHHSLQTG